MGNQSTAVATANQQGEDGQSLEEIAKNAPTKEAIDRIREGGALAVEKKKELNKLDRQLQGMEWGNVHGASFSPATRYALAELIYITRANPQLHIDVLGGKPYLNASYWTDLANSHDHFIGYESFNLDLEHVEVLRQQAKEVEQEIAQLQQVEGEDLSSVISDLRREAVQLSAQARQVERQRVHYGVPEIATAAYEVVVRRYRPNAPLDQIVSGAIDGEPFVQEIREANWAPNHQTRDPIGRDNPHTTARTRALRRAFVKAFSAWMEPLEEDIKRIENAIEAEYTVIRSEQKASRAALPSGDQPQAARSGGEPSAAAEDEAEDLPTEDAEGSDDFDATEARKAYFGTLRDAGISEEDRKAWQVGHELPASTKKWGRAEYDRAMQILIAPVKEKFEIGCQAIGEQPDAVAADVLEGRQPETYRDYQQLAAHVNGMVDAAMAEDNGQGRLV